MGDVLCTRAHPLGTKEAARGDVRIDVHQALVLQHHAAAALILEADLARDEAARLQAGVAVADDGQLRIGEHHGQHGAACQRAHVGPARGVVAGGLAFVGGLVQ
ncbi:hypothetical protein D3C81_1213340 [compost metagenome]